MVRSDQQSLPYLLQQREINPEYQKWVRKLLGFDFEIQFKPGASNRVADALSRKQEEDVQMGAMLTTYQVDWAELNKEISPSLELLKIYDSLGPHNTDYAGFHLQNGRLLYKERVVIPRNSIFILVLLNQYHDSVIGGHWGN